MSSDYRDRYGFLHHKLVRNGDPLTSENAPLFDGTNIALKFMNNQLLCSEAFEYTDRVWLLCEGEYWKVTPVSDRSDFSRDNWAGVFMGLECCERKAKKWGNKKLLYRVRLLKKRIPDFHHQLDHPRDFLQVIGFKYKLLRPFTMWASKLAAIVSMYQSHKKRANFAMAKTDGKIIGLGLCIAFNWKWTLAIMNRFLSRKRTYPMPGNAWHMCTKHKGMKWSWDNWGNIFHDYFNDINHPNVQLVKNDP